MPPPDTARYARAAAFAVGARYEDLDDGGGYLFRISLGNRSVLGGGGHVCAYPVNSATSYTVSRDKAHTKAVLTSLGLPVIPGGVWFAHTRRAALRGPGREAADAIAHAAAHGYPVFCKPNHGSRGTFAERVSSPAQLADYICRVADEFESFLIEPVMDGTEHRVLILDGRPVFHSTKAAPELVGDGVSTLARLLADQNAAVAGEGVSSLPLSALGEADPASVPSPGVRIPLLGRRNLSAAGGIESVSEQVPPPLARLAIDAVKALGLRLGAVDIFDVSDARDLSAPVVIEVNGNPGLRTLELAGRNDLIRSIWVHVLNACLKD